MTESPKKTFKEYYADPKFKERHTTYIKQKIQCPCCAREVARYNLSNHKKTKRCVAKSTTLTAQVKKDFDEAFAIAMKMVADKQKLII